MTSPEYSPFSISEPLPAGRLAIQASAGTGKTFTLAALATKCIAEEDVSAAQLLIVTFTRAATSELRSRVRDRLVEAANYLAQEDPPLNGDELLEYLARDDRPRRLERVRQAISEFDAATITTIHGFASQVLGSLGSTCGTDPDAMLQSDDEDVYASACTDVLSAAAAGGVSGAALPSYRSLLKASRTAGGASDLDLVPHVTDETAGNDERLMASLVHDVLREMVDRRRLAGTRSFNDLLTDLRDALSGAGSDAAVQAIRERYKVALIDEFQDTDGVQWDIFNLLFGAADSGSSLILVGDPKQAIYAFRGANVHTFLTAVSSSDLTRRSLDTNWRSDGAVLDSLRVLLEGATFGDDSISFTPTRVAPLHAPQRMTDADGRDLPALSLRLALGHDIERNTARPFDVKVESGRKAIYRDMAAQIRELLGGARLPGEPGEDRPVRPSDIAVLVRTRKEAAAAQRELLDQGVPAVLARGESVLDSPAADQWRWLLWALSRPSDPGRARAFALTWFGGWSAERVAEATEDSLSALLDQLKGWADTLVRHGVAPFIRQIWSESGVVARVLARTEGDRAMTDLQHVGELLQAAAPSVRSSVAGLLSVIDTEPEVNADADDDGDTTARRIESEANAVQVMTVWVAKGLEFPIVCCPTLWCAPAVSDGIYVDPVTGRRTFGVTKSKTWPDRETALARAALATQETLGERLRLLYVALTRSRHHTMLWWSRGSRSNTTALAHILFARIDGEFDQELYHAEKVDLPDDDDACAALEFLRSRSEGAITVNMHGDAPRPQARWVDPEAPHQAPSLELALLGHVPDRSRHRWSFTALTSEAPTSSFDPYDDSGSDGGADDERATDESGAERPQGDRAPALEASKAIPAMALLPAGTAFGTRVHQVLEAIDFSGENLAADLRSEIERLQTREPIDLAPLDGDGSEPTGPELLVAGLASVIDTPLGAGVGDRRLRDLALGDRINEMSFELRMGEGGSVAKVRDIGRLLVAHLPEDDPFHEWAQLLAGGAINLTLAGHLTGSIDLIFRAPDREGQVRFVVADYKTNRLSRRGHAPTSTDYGQERMAQAMVEHHYPLQALLYSVALHRYLRWRVPDYVPGRHLGGATYLFLRGMDGGRDAGRAERPDGVFHWDIPPRLVVQLSDLLDGHLHPGNETR
jgi:exodeoxyribonuclease V beta subunit